MDARRDSLQVDIPGKRDRNPPQLSARITAPLWQAKLVKLVLDEPVKRGTKGLRRYKGQLVRYTM